MTCTRPKWRFSKEKHFFSPDNQKSKKILQTLMVCVKKWLEIVPVQIGVLPKRNIISFPIPILLLIYQSVASCPKNQKAIQKNHPTLILSLPICQIWWKNSWRKNMKYKQFRRKYKKILAPLLLLIYRRVARCVA